MGAWGTAISSDDTVLDIVSTYKDTLKKTQSYSKARESVEEQYSSEVLDEEEQHLYWLALAEVQWKYDNLDEDVILNVKTIISKGKGLELWREEGNKILLKREKVLEVFLKKISGRNTKPTKMPKIIKRKVLFQDGDCLSIERINGGYIAGVVKRVDLEDVEYPSYLIQFLNWNGLSAPTEKLFLSCEELIVNDPLFKGKKKKASAWFGNTGFRKYQSMISVICNKQSFVNHNESSRTYSPWELIDGDFYIIENNT